MEYPEAQLSGPDRIRLVVALSAAKVAPFTRDDWSGWSGAVGAAHTVVFHAADHAHLLGALGLGHVDPDCVLVVLDEAGLTWNVWSPFNAYAWQVRVGLGVDVDDRPLPDGEYWEASYAGDAELAAQIASLPPHVRGIALACPEEARPHFVRGWRAAEAAGQPVSAKATTEWCGVCRMPLWADGCTREQCARVAKEERPRTELEHNWPRGARP